MDPRCLSLPTLMLVPGTSLHQAYCITARTVICRNGATLVLAYDLRSSVNTAAHLLLLPLRLPFGLDDLCFPVNADANVVRLWGGDTIG